MLYVFEKSDGTRIDVDLPFGTAPSIGSQWFVDGEPCTRVASFIVGDGIIAQRSKYPYLSNRLPTTIRGAKIVRDPRSGRFKPMIESRRHETEVMAKNDLQRDGEGV